MLEERVKIRLPELHPAQQQVINERKRFNVLCCGRRWGKSALAVDLLSETAIAGLPAGYFTPTYKLLAGTYSECLKALEPIIKRQNEHNFIELITGGRIEFWSLENELAGRSRKYARDIIDEGAFAKSLWKTWTESIRATLTDLKGDAWFLSTPKGKNDFYKLYMRGKQGDENWVSWQMSTYTNPHMDASEIDDARADLPAIAFSQEYLAEFNDNVANPFGTTFIAQCTYPISDLPAVCYGVDLAKSFDYTVIIGLDRNCQVCYFQRFQKDWKETTQAIINLSPGNIAIDSTGVGDPIAEEVARHRAIDSIKYTSVVKQQLMEGLAVAIQKREITFPEGPIVDELNNFEFEFTRTGVKYSAPAGLHDDCVNALALARKGWSGTGQGNYAIW